MKHPIAVMIDELTRKATMKFRAEDIARVQRVANRITKGENITVECPLAVWDSGAMGVAFKRVQNEIINGEKHKIRRTASFVLTQDELEREIIIAQKAGIALQAIVNNVLSQVREVKQEKPNVGRTEAPAVHDGTG